MLMGMAWGITGNGDKLGAGELCVEVGGAVLVVGDGGRVCTSSLLIEEEEEEEEILAVLASK